VRGKPVHSATINNGGIGGGEFRHVAKSDWFDSNEDRLWDAMIDGIKPTSRAQDFLV
jgi:hypothetical protein